MDMQTFVETPVQTSVDDIWAMRDTHEYTADVWGEYRQMTDFVDVVNYLRFVMTSDDPTTAKLGQKAISWLGFAMPSLAYICPSQTTDLTYFEHLVVINVPAEYLNSPYGYYADPNVTDAQLALDAAFYRTIGGRDMHDGELRATCDSLYHKILENGASLQGVTALDTVTGRFDVLPNLIAMMAFELCDKALGTSYSDVNGDILAFIEDKLQDPDTKLFYESYMTGKIGYEGENLDSRNFWTVSKLSASINALALTFYRYFDPDNAKIAWESFKDAFGDELLALTAEDVAPSVGASFYTSMGATAEGLFGAIAAAAEMEDEDFFGQLQGHVFEIGEPVMTEGSLHFDAFGDGEAIMGMFLTFARTHIPWQTLLEHDWENYFDVNESIMH